VQSSELSFHLYKLNLTSFSDSYFSQLFNSTHLMSMKIVACTKGIIVSDHSGLSHPIKLKLKFNLESAVFQSARDVEKLISGLVVDSVDSQAVPLILKEVLVEFLAQS